MEKYHTHTLQSKKNINMVKLRIVTLIALICLIVCQKPTSFEELRDKVSGRVTSYMLPLFTYEEENGQGDVDYTSVYAVPEWFYEDENAQSNGDMAVNDNVNISNDKQSVEAISDGVLGVTYTRDELAQPDFLLSHVYVVDNNTSMTADEMSLENLMDTNMKVENISCNTTIETQNAPPKILIYHTHGSESFADSRPGVKEDTIVGVGAYLEEILEQEYHIPVYHDETAYDMIDGTLDRSKAYEKAYENVSRILKENPSIEVVIDLHRDGVNEETHLVTEVSGKPTAKIMFLNGVSRSNMNGEIAYLENPNKKQNLAFSFQMYIAGKERYGDYVRKIYVRSLRYNLHLMPRTTLIEVGAQNNTLEEEKNAMEPLAAILNEVLSGE